MRGRPAAAPSNGHTPQMTPPSTGPLSLPTAPLPCTALQLLIRLFILQETACDLAVPKPVLLADQAEGYPQYGKSFGRFLVMRTKNHWRIPCS